MIKIIAFGRGHVVVAEVADTKADFLRLDNAATIRVWGTSTGLGELANGPLSNTVLDAIPYGLEIPASAVHGFWNVSEAGQKKFSDLLKKQLSDRVKNLK